MRCVRNPSEGAFPPGGRDTFLKQYVTPRNWPRPRVYADRSTAFGTCALVIIKRTNDNPQMLLNIRGDEMAETPNLSHVAPAGTFQPNHPDDYFHEREFSLESNLIREFVEELLDEKSLRSNPPASDCTSYEKMFSAKGKRFLEVVTNKQRYCLLYLGTIVDPLNLKPEAVTVFLIHEGYLEQVTDGVLTPTWETKRFGLKEFTMQEIDRLIRERHHFVPTGVAHLTMVKKHFNSISRWLARV